MEITLWENIPVKSRIFITMFRLARATPNYAFSVMVLRGIGPHKRDLKGDEMEQFLLYLRVDKMQIIGLKVSLIIIRKKLSDFLILSP